jgi:hypothetical protein
MRIGSGGGNAPWQLRAGMSWKVRWEKRGKERRGRRENGVCQPDEERAIGGMERITELEERVSEIGW